MKSGTEYFKILKSFDTYGSAELLDLNPFPVITIILVTSLLKHSFIKLLIILFDSSSVNP